MYSYNTEGPLNSNNVVKLDIDNAFNSIRRDHTLSVAHDEVHQICAKVIWKPLRCCSEIKSATGLLQGDLSRQPLFAFSINNIVKSIAVLLNVWYLDDAQQTQYMVDLKSSPSALLKSSPKLSDIGINVNPQKSQIIFLSDTVDKVTDLTFLCSTRYPDDCGEWYGDFGGSSFHAQLTSISNTNASRGWLIASSFLMPTLYSCCLIPKFIYIFRMTKAYLRPIELSELDTIRDGLANICNV